METREGERVKQDEDEGEDEGEHGKGNMTMGS